MRRVLSLSGNWIERAGDREGDRERERELYFVDKLNYQIMIGKFLNYKTKNVWSILKFKVYKRLSMAVWSIYKLATPTIYIYPLEVRIVMVA